MIKAGDKASKAVINKEIIEVAQINKYSIKGMLDLITKIITIT
jgi:hypothetical protein